MIQLIQWAVTSSVLILIVLGLRYLFRNKLSARLRYALWGIVLLRLLVPFQVELPAAAPLPVLASNLAQDVTPRLENQMFYAVPTEVYPGNGRVQPGEPPEFSRTLHGGVGSDWDYYAGGVRFDENGTTRYAFMMPASELLVVLWKWGAALFLIFVFYSNWCFSMRLDRSRKRLERINVPIPVYVAEGLPSPCLFGVLRPAVYVTPEAAANPDTLRHVLAHELTHYAHKDHIWSLLRILALALHWYNPLVWLAVGLSKGDGELACDEGAVARLGEGERIPYGRTLVDMVAARSLRPADLLSCSTAMTGGKKSIQQRVAQLVKKPQTVKTALFAAVAVVALAAVFVFAGRGDNQILEVYRDTVDQANSVVFISSPLSSIAYPTIIDDDSVSQAKEILLDISPLKSGEKPDLTGLAFAPSVTLLGAYDTNVLMQVQYTLSSQNGRTYVLAWSSQPDGSTGYEVVGYLPDTVCSRLENLARQQENQTGSGSPVLDQFLAEAERAGSVRLQLSPLSSANPPEPITDPDLLALIRERLAGFIPVGEDWIGPGWSKLLTASKLVLSDGERETVYALVVGSDNRTYLFSEADYEACRALGEGETRKVTALARTSSNVETSLYSYARMQKERDGDPNYPVPMTRAGLSRHTPEGIWEAIGYQLQGWGGNLKDAEFNYGYTSLTRMQLRYAGDETHWGYWMLELLAPGISSNSSGYTVVADQPLDVFNVERYGDRLDRFYEILEPDTCAAYLRMEDVVSVTAGDYEPGHKLSLDELPDLKELLTQSLYHQFTAEYDREKHGQYVITLHLMDREEDTYLGHELAEGANRLILSAGEEADVVCLRKASFAVSGEPHCAFVRSPELYRTIRNIFD